MTARHTTASDDPATRKPAATKKTAAEKSPTQNAVTLSTGTEEAVARQAVSRRTAAERPAAQPPEAQTPEARRPATREPDPETREAPTPRTTPAAEAEAGSPATEQTASEPGRRRSRRSRGRRRSGGNRGDGGGRGRGGRGDERGKVRGGGGGSRGGRDSSARPSKPEPARKPPKRKTTPAVAAPSAAVTAERRETLTIEDAATQLGIERLHPEQKQVISETLAGNDVVMIVPTGFGKSACYQLPSMMLPKPVVVISPLLALLEDQHLKLIERNVPVVRLDGSVRGKQRTQALDRIEEGGSLLILTTPETLANPLVTERLQKSGVSLVAIDEAHCISEWGYDFRPAYQRIGSQLRALGEPPVLALTATAIEHVREAIVKSLRMRNPVVIDVSPHRSNLAFEVLPAEGDIRARVLVRLIKRLRRPGIVYCSTRREVDMIWGLLKRFRIPAHRYHGGMTAAERETEQRRYMRRGHRTVMIATNAFGLGIDKPDIRYVLHYQAPASLEQYVQEAGRGGRDGKKANCILLYDPADRQIHQALLNRSRIRPDQLFKLGAALEAWNDEQRSPTLEALALSADLGPRITQALLTKIEEAGFVDCDGSEIEIVNPDRSIEEDTRSLAGQFERLRREDSRRLDLIGDYAVHNECRAQFLQSYFGEASDEECGLCDVCRGKPRRPTGFFAPLALPKVDRGKKKKRPSNRGDSKRGGRRSRGGRRRRGRGPRGGGGGGGDAGSSGN